MSEKQEKYCVLGATSFGGQATIRSLLKEKHEVVAIARRETQKNRSPSIIMVQKN